MYVEVLDRSEKGYFNPIISSSFSQANGGERGRHVRRLITGEVLLVLLMALCDLIIICLNPHMIDAMPFTHTQTHNVTINCHLCAM